MNVEGCIGLMAGLDAHLEGCTGDIKNIQQVMNVTMRTGEMRKGGWGAYPCVCIQPSLAHH